VPLLVLLENNRLQGRQRPFHTLNALIEVLP
jgi:hypothetical protein